jgi:CDP-diacylglycerol--glycerol-3-phosphate 3-phosphatidyltransferase
MLTFNSQTVHVSDILLLIADVLVLVATLWTIFSGVEYILGARSLFTDPVDAARKEN